MSTKRLSVEQARETGRRRRPLHLRGMGRTLILENGAGGDYVVIEVRAGRGDTAIFRSFPKSKPVMQGPSITGTHLHIDGGTFIKLLPEELPIVSAWLDGYFGDAS